MTIVTGSIVVWPAEKRCAAQENRQPIACGHSIKA
jgi:hypothetical protein